jgi:hypothetical protein
MCCIMRSTAILLPLLLYWIRALSDRPFRSQTRRIGHKHWPGVVEVQVHYILGAVRQPQSQLVLLLHSGWTFSQ